MDNPQFTPEEIERFWSKVERREPDDCWLWTAAPGGNGYGYFWGGKKHYRAHRVSYYLAHGRWPQHLACHRCDTPLCVNPLHIFDGTNKDNQRDASQKGRMANSKKTHCPAGHAYDEKNTKVDKMGRRTCRTCQNASQMAHYYRTSGRRHRKVEVGIIELPEEET